MNLIILCVYCFLWLLTFVIYVAKRRKTGDTFGAGGIILLSYFIYSVFSVLLYNTKVFFAESDSITVFPFMYLYGIEMLFLYPILRYRSNTTQLDHLGDLFIFNIISIIFIFSSLIHLPTVLLSFREGLYQIMTDPSGGAELYAERMEMSYESGGGITNLFAIISSALSGIGILFLVYSFVNNKVNKWIRLGLLLSYIVLLMNGVSSGQRGLLIEPLYVAIVSYFFFQPYISQKINRVISIAGITIIIALSIPFAALTFSRFDTVNSGVAESFYFYAGQENVYFNLYGLDDNGIRYGDRTVPLFKRMIGFTDVPKNFWERREKYPHLKINDEVFYTYVGDFTIDFGPVLGTVIMLLMALLFARKTDVHYNRISFEQLIVLHFLMYMCMVGGLKLFPFSDVAGNLKIIVYFTAYLLFKYLTIKKSNQYDV